jgi:hypothetical protein
MEQTEHMDERPTMDERTTKKHLILVMNILKIFYHLTRTKHLQRFLQDTLNQQDDRLFLPISLANMVHCYNVLGVISAEFDIHDIAESIPLRSIALKTATILVQDIPEYVNHFTKQHFDYHILYAMLDTFEMLESYSDDSGAKLHKMILECITMITRLYTNDDDSKFMFTDCIKLLLYMIQNDEYTAYCVLPSVLEWVKISEYFEDLYDLLLDTMGSNFENFNEYKDMVQSLNNDQDRKEQINNEVERWREWYISHYVNGEDIVDMINPDVPDEMLEPLGILSPRSSNSQFGYRYSDSQLVDPHIHIDIPLEDESSDTEVIEITTS